jgi:hypothetical protein
MIEPMAGTDITEWLTLLLKYVKEINKYSINFTVTTEFNGVILVISQHSTFETLFNYYKENLK